MAPTPYFRTVKGSAGQLFLYINNISHTHTQIMLVTNKESAFRLRDSRSITEKVPSH